MCQNNICFKHQHDDGEGEDPAALDQQRVYNWFYVDSKIYVIPWQGEDPTTGIPTEAASKQRKAGDRIYDFAVYNDLGDANKPAEIRRILGGKATPTTIPYPRRLRTGRGLIDGKYETRNLGGEEIVPRPSHSLGLCLAVLCLYMSACACVCVCVSVSVYACVCLSLPVFPVCTYMCVPRCVHVCTPTCLTNPFLCLLCSECVCLSLRSCLS